MGAGKRPSQPDGENGELSCTRTDDAARRGEREGRPELSGRRAGANLSRYYCYSCYRLSSYNKRRSVAMYTRRHRVYIPHNVVYAIPYRKP